MNAIYSALEITSILNKRQDNTLPRGFRSQGKKGKYPLFEMNKWKWLPLFYDLRTLFAHYASPFPLLKDKVFLINVEEPSGLLVLVKGQQRVEFDTVLSFADHLFTLLDTWALDKLQDVDPETKVTQIHSRNFYGPLKGKDGKARPFLQIARRFQKLALQQPEMSDNEWLQTVLNDITIKR